MRRSACGRHRGLVVAGFAVVVLVVGVGLPLGAAGFVRVAAENTTRALEGVVLLTDDDSDDDDSDDGSEDDSDDGADDEQSDASEDREDGGSSRSDSEGGSSGGDGSGPDRDSADDGDDGAREDDSDEGGGREGGGGDGEDGEDGGAEDDGAEDDGADDDGADDDGGDDESQEFAGRDEIGTAGRDEYVDITDVEPNGNIGLGGDFSGGSYTIECDITGHNNTDNFIIAPGVRNGAQHTHEHAGNESTNAQSDDETLEEADTTCTNGDLSPIFWPVLRDLGGVGPDVGLDGGSLDGNVGAFVEPASIDMTFHGHGTRETEPMPLTMTLITGSAKASTADGEGSNSKFSCTGFADRLTDLYPICPDDSQLMRIFDFPSCWPGEATASEDFVSHIVYPDESGECADDEIPVPALRITVSYDQPPGRQFAIDSFPEQQHDPVTDHALLEYLSTERRAQQGADCINSAQRCVQGAVEDRSGSGSTDPDDELALSRNFAAVMGSHGDVQEHGGVHRGTGRTATTSAAGRGGRG